MEILLSELSQLTENSRLNLFVFNYETDELFAIKNGDPRQIPVPDILKDPLHSLSTYVSHFKKNDKLTSFYLFRTYTSEGRIALILQEDDKLKGIEEFLKICSFLTRKISPASPTQTINLSENNANKSKELEESCEQLNKELSELKESHKKLINEIKQTEDKLNETETHLNAKITHLQSEVEERAESMEVLRQGRQKFFRMVDSICFPFFSVQPDFTMNNVNGAAAKMSGVKSPAQIYLKTCYSTVYACEEMCPWCSYDKVLEEGETVIQTIQPDENKETFYRHVMLPIKDMTGKTVEAAELLLPYTEETENLKNLDTTRDKYGKLAEEYDKALGKLKSQNDEIERLTVALEQSNKDVFKYKNAVNRILQEEEVADMLRIKAENKELSSKIERAALGLRNYQAKLDKAEQNYRDLSKKSAIKAETLINILNNKNIPNRSDVDKVITTVAAEIKRLREIHEKRDLKEEEEASKE